MPDSTAPSSGGRNSFNLLSNDGLRLARALVRPLVPFDIHDYQLEGTCALVQGADLLACLPTGSGKTAFFFLPILLSSALSKCCELPESLRARYPADAALLAILPTNSLELEKEKELRDLGVSALAINADTQARAKQRGEDLWATVQRKRVSVILLSPEQLVSKGFERLINDEDFLRRLRFLDMDEVHLLDSWGANFRKAFLQIGYVRARLPAHVRLAALTATLLDGERKRRVLHFLGLKAGQFHAIHRSNMRYDIQPLIRTLSAGLGGRRFPDLDWVLARKRKTIIFCKTIILSFRVLIYLWHRAPTVPSRSARIRLYNSLNSPTFNAETQRLMQSLTSDLQIIIATATLTQGSNSPNVEDVIILGDLEDPDDFTQQIGRAGRDRRLVSDARGILYITPGAREAARGVLGLPLTKKPSGSAPKMHLGVARLLLATCLRDEQDSLYNNPIDDPPCSCQTCASNPPLSKPAHCNCSGCAPDTGDMLPPTLQFISEDPSVSATVEAQLSREERESAEQQLVAFRWSVWKAADEVRFGHIPPASFLRDSTITSLLDNLASISSFEKMMVCVREARYLRGHHVRLWVLLSELRQSMISAPSVTDSSRGHASEQRNPADPQSTMDDDHDRQTKPRPRARIVRPTRTSADTEGRSNDNATIASAVLPQQEQSTTKGVWNDNGQLVLRIPRLLLRPQSPNSKRHREGSVSESPKLEFEIEDQREVKRRRGRAVKENDAPVLDFYTTR